MAEEAGRKYVTIASACLLPKQWRERDSGIPKNVFSLFHHAWAVQPDQACSVLPSGPLLHAPRPVAGQGAHLWHTHLLRFPWILGHERALSWRQCANRWRAKARRPSASPVSYSAHDTYFRRGEAATILLKLQRGGRRFSRISSATLAGAIARSSIIVGLRGSKRVVRWTDVLSGENGQRQGTVFVPNRKRVFVVDDDAGTLRAIERLLRAYGYATVVFPSAEAFEDHCEIEAGLCVILDINLNDNRSGIDLRLGLKAAGCSVPVIYMTGNDNPAVHKAAVESGCTAYLLKPVSVRSLIRALERASGLGQPNI
jgi:CheY-like chemotaxis protein